MSEQGNKPIHHVRFGDLSVPIWENQSSRGPFLSAGLPEKRYRDDQSGEWKTSKSLTAKDCTALSLVYQQAAVFMEDNRPQREEAPANHSGQSAPQAAAS